MSIYIRFCCLVEMIIHKESVADLQSYQTESIKSADSQAAIYILANITVILYSDSNQNL